MSHYRFSSRRVISSTALAVVAYAISGCGNAEVHNPDGNAGNSPGGQSSQGGASSAGGTTQAVGNGGSSSSQGGGNPDTGGSSSIVQSTGGMATGGNAAGGGATGGKSNSGGAAVGGSSTGGKSNSGGAAVGGSSTGGKSNSGGAAVGGGATGGKSNSGGTVAGGGTSSSGGAATGGAATGGGATGGRTSTGGAATGGAATGGAATGGAATGGASAVAIGGTHSGQGTFYDYNNNGHCSFTSTYNNQDFAALNSSDYGSATWCGACVDVTGPKGTVSQVIIVDECPSCAAGDLDFKPATFDKIADHSAGRVQITWHFVPCNVTGPIQYHYKEGSSPGWTSVQIINSRLPVSKVEYSTDNGNTWKPLTRQTYNYFEVSSGFGGAAMVRVTASTGATLTESLPVPTSDSTYTGTKNF
jgi:expansin